MREPAAGTPGHTAVLAAVGRALHREGGTPMLVDDYLALDLAGTAGTELLASLRTQATPEGLVTLGLAFAMRARVVEDELQTATGDTVAQYLVLGAGLDSFAYRRGPDTGEMRIYEVDRPGAQEWKRSRLAELGIAEPANTVYVPVDFERGGLRLQLEAAGFDFSAPTVVSWIAVVQYLKRESVDATLALAGSLPPGSRLVMTYVVPPSELSEVEQRGLAWTMDQAAGRAEPFLTLLRPEEVEALLRDHGFATVDHLDPAELRRRYLPDRPDLALPGIERIVVATR